MSCRIELKQHERVLERHVQIPIPNRRNNKAFSFKFSVSWIALQGGLDYSRNKRKEGALTRCAWEKK